MFISRKLTFHLRELAQYFPVLSLTGPRQAGKTTLLQELFNDYHYLSFEDPEYRQRFANDPRDFLERYSHRVIFDEAQRVPELFSYLQGIVDADRRPGRFILSGSQNFLLHQTITQSLAGRVGVTRLMPLDLAELYEANLLPATKEELICNGFYPMHFQINIPPRLFYPNYLATYLERDVGEWIHAANVTIFRRFLHFCATMIGQTLNRSMLAKSIGVSVPTVNAWLSILERSYILFLLPPYFNNLGKRLIKNPKLYFVDTGLAAYLLELTDPERVINSPYHGALFENMVVAELFKQRQHQGQNFDAYFFRDSNGVEVDLIEHQHGRVLLTEIKSSATFHPEMTKTLAQLAGLFSVEKTTQQIIYNGQEGFQYQNVQIKNWRQGYLF